MSPPHTPQYVIFDFGRVLVDWDPRHLCRKLFDHEEEMTFFLENVCDHAWRHRSDRGVPMDTLVEEAQGKFPQYSEAIAAQRDRFGETIVGAIEGTVQLLDTLHQRDVPLYGLTNWARETYQFAEQFSFLERFIDVVVSGFEEVAKPEAEIFLRLLDRNKLDAEQGFFIDDSPANVAAAQKLGLRAHTFTTPETLAVELRALRLLE